MQKRSYSQLLNQVSEYAWRNPANPQFLQQEKQYMEDCLQHITLVPLPNLGLEEMQHVRNTIKMGMQDLPTHRETLTQLKKELHAKVFATKTRLTAAQIQTWDALNALFPSAYTASGDPLVESFSESMVLDFAISEEFISSLLYKHFTQFIEE